MDADQQRAVLTLCLMAAFADGANSDAERAEIKRIASTLGADSALDAATIDQDLPRNKPDVRAVAAAITLPEQRQLAYEMAVGVCNADGPITPAERAFLESVAVALGVEQSSAQQFVQNARALAEPSLAGPAPDGPIVSPRRRPTPPPSMRRSSTMRSSTARWSCCRKRWRRWRSFRCR